jgi:hypothetical protein
MTRFLLLILLLLAAVAARVSVAPAAPALPKLGIVSAIGDKLYLRKVGITVFGNESSEMAVDSWRLDDVMTGKIRAALAGRFDVRPVTYQRAPFSALAEREELFPRERRPELVRAGVSPAGLDAYLVITKSTLKYSQTNQILFGLGIVERSSLLEPGYHVYANYALGLVDGHTWEVTANTAGNLPNHLVTAGMRGVIREVDKSFWPASPDPAANQRLKGALVDLIDKSVSEPLERMRLVPPQQSYDTTIKIRGRD